MFFDTNIRLTGGFNAGPMSAKQQNAFDDFILENEAYKQVVKLDHRLHALKILKAGKEDEIIKLLEQRHTAVKELRLVSKKWCETTLAEMKKKEASEIEKTLADAEELVAHGSDEALGEIIDADSLEEAKQIARKALR